MNCANHPNNPAVAYCRTCGKPLCGSCTREVQGVVYCEQCLAERMGHPVTPQQPATGFVSSGPAPVRHRRRSTSSRSGYSCRVLPFRCRGRVHRTICKGIGTPCDFHFADLGRRCHSQWRLKYHSWLGHRIFLRLPDHRRRSVGACHPHGTTTSGPLRIGSSLRSQRDLS